MSWSIQHVKPNYQITSEFTFTGMKHENVQSFVVHFLHPEDLFIAASRMTFLGTKKTKKTVLLQKKAKDGFVRESFDCRRVDLKKKKN